MRHTALLKIPGTRFSKRDELIRFQIDQTERCGIIFGRQPIFDRRFQDRDVSLIRAPGIDAIIGGKKMLFGAGRDGYGFGCYW